MKLRSMLDSISNDHSPTDQLIQGIPYMKDILEEIRSMNINSQLDSFGVPGLQKQLRERINMLTTGSGTAKVGNGVQSSAVYDDFTFKVSGPYSWDIQSLSGYMRGQWFLRTEHSERRCTE